MKIDLLSKAQLSIINKNNYRYPLVIAEKDYILAIILKIIYNSSLKNQLVFKGGTAIHHLYLDQLRFSEDLDFNAIGPVSIDNLMEVFAEHDFLEIVKYHTSDFALKIERIKFWGPLDMPNSIKIDIDLGQNIFLPAKVLSYKNCYMVPVSVRAMDLKEICAEKIRAINERARYRDFYDLTLAMKIYKIEPKEIIHILFQKELRKPLSKHDIIENLNLAESAMLTGAENISYREVLNTVEIKALINELTVYL